jgi:glyoxylase-like metal-dependent hydrolase (beta-lactamase superfamily II)
MVRSVRHGSPRTPLPAEAGVTLDLPGRPHVVPVPGHTVSSVAFHISDRGVVLTGDALVTYDGLVGKAGPRTVCAAFTHSTSQGLASLSALESLDAGLGCPDTAPRTPAASRPRSGAARDAGAA